MTKRNTYWNRDETMNLIKMLRQRQCLWRISSKEYHSKTKRTQAFQEISDYLSKPIFEIKNKIHKLRAQHSGERSKIKKKSNADKSFTSKWEYFEALKFLFVSKDFPDTEIDPLDTVITDIKVEFDESLPLPPPLESLQKKIKKISPDETIQPNQSNQPNVKLLKPDEFSFMDDHVDDHQVFADYIASEFRVLKNDKHRLLLRRKIQKAIMEVSELEEQNSTNYQFGESS